MEEFNCNQLKNIEIPESWIENAINAAEKKKKAVLPPRFFRCAAGIAACVVLAAAITFSVLFGVGDNASPVLINTGSPSKPGALTAETSQNSTGESAGFASPPSAVQSGENQTAAALTDPAEKAGVNGDSSSAANRQSSNPVPDSTKAQAQKGGSADNTEEPREPYVSEKTEALTIPCADGASQPQNASTGEKKCYVKTIVSPELAEEDIFFCLEDINGNIAGNAGLFDSSRSAKKEVNKNGDIVLSYTVDYSGEEEGKIFSAVFYNSNGEVIKRSNPVPFYENLYFSFR